VRDLFKTLAGRRDGRRENDDDDTIKQDPRSCSRAGRAHDIGTGGCGGSDALGAGAGHGLRLRQGRQDIFLQDGHQQCGPAVEGRQEGAQGHAVLHRPERPALYENRIVSRRRRLVHVRPGPVIFKAAVLNFHLGGFILRDASLRDAPLDEDSYQTLMVRSRALRGVSNHEAAGKATTTRVNWKRPQNAAASSLAPGKLLLLSMRASVTASSLATVLWRIATGFRS